MDCHRDRAIRPTVSLMRKEDTAGLMVEFGGLRRELAPAWPVISAILAVLLLVILGAAELNGGALWTEPSANVEISTITLGINYEGNRSGYLGPTHQDECVECPVHLQEGMQANFGVVKVHFNTTGPSSVYTTTTMNSTYPFQQWGYLSLSPNSNPPLLTSQTIYNVSYLAGSTLEIYLTFQIPAHPISVGSVTISIVASPNPLPKS